MEADSVERRQEELGIHILENIRNELYYYFPYLDGAFACISLPIDNIHARLQIQFTIMKFSKIL